MIILNSLFPVLFLIVLGICLKRLGLTGSEFLQQSDRLVYNIFFPVMLFYKIGGASFEQVGEWGFIAVTIGVVLLMFLVTSWTVALISFIAVAT